MAGVVSTVEGAKGDIQAADEVVQGGSFMAEIYKHAGAKIVGGFAEKVCYYFVFLLSLGFFLLSVGNVLSTLANDKVTSFDVTQNEELPFPIFWYCFDSDDIDSYTDSSRLNFGFYLRDEAGKHKPVDVDAHPAPGTDCPEPADFALINVPRGVEGANIDDSTTCYGRAELDKAGPNTDAPCAADADPPCRGRGKHTFVKKLEKEMKDILTSDYQCYVVNDGGQLPPKKRLEGGPLLRKFMTEPVVGMDPNIYIGFTDPDIDLESGHIITGKPQKLNYYNAYIDVSLTTETVTESDKVTFLTPSSSAVDGTTRRHYYGQITSTPLTVQVPEAHRSSDDAEYIGAEKVGEARDLPLRLARAETSVYYQFSSFLSRDVTIRRKSLAEAWAEVGGAWATALMLITFFFLPRQQGYEEWQVFRFRSVRSRKDLLRKVAEGAKEAGFVSTDYMAGDVETGAKKNTLLNPEWPEESKGGRK